MSYESDYYVSGYEKVVEEEVVEEIVEERCYRGTDKLKQQEAKE